MKVPVKTEVPRALVPAREPIQAIALHTFGDASAQGVATAVNAVVEQMSGMNQGLVAAKAHHTKQGLTIPCLELVAGHMAINLLTNVHDTLTGYPFKSLNAWPDSTVALLWIRGTSEYKQFVGNHVHKIKEKESVIWRHVLTQEIPADLGSQRRPVNKENVLWWEGPNWLKDPASWPPDFVTTATPESDAEAKATKQVFALAVNGTKTGVFDELLSKRSLWRCLTVGVWVQRFINNARNYEHKRQTGALTTEEINYQKLPWEKKTKRSVRDWNSLKTIS